MAEQNERKLKHYFEKGAIYFVTSVTKERKPIFSNIIAARFLLITIAYHKFVLNFKLFAYVIMLEHFHLLLQPSEKYSLSKIMNYIKGNFAKKYNEFLNPTTRINLNSIGNSASLSISYEKDYKKDPRGWIYLPVWQKRYYESIVRDERDFLEKLNYIHNNPVKRGLVVSPDEYEFSSYHQYYGKEREKIQIPIDKILL